MVFGHHTEHSYYCLQNILSPKAFATATKLLFSLGILLGSTVGIIVLSYIAASPTFGWTGRSLSLLDPTYASKYIPIIASVSEHQPPTTYSYIQGMIDRDLKLLFLNLINFDFDFDLLIILIIAENV